MSQEIIEPFRPLEVLSQKPIATSFDNVHKHLSIEEEGKNIRDIVENNIEYHKDFNRDHILEKLRDKGFLVKSCEPKKRDENTPQPVEKPTDSPNSSDTSISIPSLEENTEKQHSQTEKRKTNEIIEFDDIDPEMETENEVHPVNLPDKGTYNENTVKETLMVDEDIIFIVCSDKEKPFGEKLNRKQKPDFLSLFSVPDWRMKLCNSYESSIEIDGVSYSSVQHYMIAAQYKNLERSDLFDTYENSLEILKTKTYKKDDDFEKRESKEMYNALFAKFTQNQNLAKILHATKNAQLMVRTSPKTKRVFYELMWLRQNLRQYVEHTLKPLDTDTTKEITTTQKNKIDDDLDLGQISLGKYATQLPKFKPEIVKTSSYYMNNRTLFIQKIKDIYKNVSQHKNYNETFDIMEHQKIVRNYLNHLTPYHGSLIYHNLGAGKSCTSISITEGMKHTKKVYVLLPASLETNFWAELQKCGNFLYKQNQHWEFVPIEGNQELAYILAKALNMNVQTIMKKKGAWMVDTNKDPNFSDLNKNDQTAIQEQIVHMINKKYIPIHYNASNLNKIVKEYNNAFPNMFDNSVVVIDEAHNFVTKIVNNLKTRKKDSPYITLYDKLMSARNVRIVMLSGTPIINDPHEISVMFNILRGYISTWTFTINRTDNGKQKVNSEYINSLLNKNECLVHDFVEYSGNKLLITRNPYGFVNLINKPSTTKKNMPLISKQNKSRKQFGGYGEYGVTLDEKGKITNDQFIKKVKSILEANGLNIEGSPKFVNEKCLPDNYKTFIELFVKKTTDYSDTNNKEGDLLKIQTLRKRILGLTSYFRFQGDNLLPKFIKDSEGNIFNEIKVPMSEYQMSEYAKVRKGEIEKEKKLRTMKGKTKNVSNGELFQIGSSYRSSSRTCCNFAFPTEIPRPKRLLIEKENEEHIDEMLVEEDEVEVKELESLKVYRQKIEDALEQLKANSKRLFSIAGLKQYSPKMLEIIKNIKDPNNKGLHLLYSAFRTLEGIGIFQVVLEVHGFQQFKIRQKDGEWELDYKHDGRPCYVLYTGTEDPKYREIIRNIFNGDLEPPNVPKKISDEMKKISENNKFGQLIKLFMITSAGAEGINLKNTRFVHIMEPFWHNVRLEQVVGRARRLKSHFDLEEEYRTVQVFLYISVMTKEQKENENFKEIRVHDLSKLKENKVITTDEYLYEISQMKQKVNSQVLRILKETSMDCHLYKSQHGKTEPLICYGKYDSAMDRNFISHPNYKIDLKEDNDRWIGDIQEDTE